jgi:hypothetical protein
MAKELPNEIALLLGTERPPELGPERRAGVLSTAEIDARLKGGGAKGDLVRAAVYLWHDHLDEAHRIAQEIETADGSLVHAIMHRREPDYWNSKYWFRRVGNHPSFEPLAAAAGALLNKAGENALAEKLLPNGRWDAFAFVDAVEAAAQGELRSKRDLLQEVQRLEFEALLSSLV